MAVILTYGDPRLEQATRPVEAFDQTLRNLIEEMFDTAVRAPGVGLAAPQIGLDLRLAVIDLSVGRDADERLVLVNPTMTEQRGRVTVEEGCLSFPGLFTTLSRPRSVRVEAVDGWGEAVSVEGEGLLAQALCHELDHLDGRLIIHHLKGLKRRMFLRRIARLRESGAWTGAYEPGPTAPATASRT